MLRKYLIDLENKVKVKIKVTYKHLAYDFLLVVEYFACLSCPKSEI